MSDWKERLGVVYSTNPDFTYNTDEAAEPTTKEPSQQNLRVWRDTHHRAGKVATVVRGFEGSSADLEELAKMLKRRLGVGGSAKDGEIIIQGEWRDRITDLLIQAGYTRTKRV